MKDWTSADTLSTSETYRSCCYRALCLSSFLSKWSLETIQILILIRNYFVTNNRTADSWAFSGILQKQTYATCLHQTPEESTSLSERQLRYRLWQAVMFQDISLSYYLELVPATAQHSIDVTSIARVDEADNNQERRMQEVLSPSSSVDLAFLTCESDTNYVHAMWRYAHFMQVNVCLPLALGVPIAKDNGHKAALVSKLQNVYDNLDQAFNTMEFRSKEPRI